MCLCRICNKQFDQINAAHLKTHGLTPQEYRGMYPEERRNVAKGITFSARRPHTQYDEYLNKKMQGRFGSYYSTKIAIN